MKNLEQGAASVVVAAVGREYEDVGGVSSRPLASLTTPTVDLSDLMRLSLIVIFLLQFYMEDCAISPPFQEDAPLGTPGYKPWAYDKDGEHQLWVDSLKMLKLPDEY